MRAFRAFLFLLLGSAAVALAATPLPTLPDFAGWQKTTVQNLAAPDWGMPAPEAAVMREYGLVAVIRAQYQRGNRHIQVEGDLFRDVNGSFGAFTYAQPGMDHPFDIGQTGERAVSGDTHVLFTRGPWLVHAEMDQVTAMTASEMRQLAVAMGPPGGLSQLPSLPYYLPRAGLVAESMRYVEGPAGWAAACPWMPASQVGFEMGAEAALGAYDNLQGTETQLAVIGYPTPQIARTHLAEMQKAFTGTGIEVRRSGPILSVVHGATPAGANQLLQSVNYDADITISEPKPAGIDALPGLILGIFVLIGMIIAVAVVVGLMTGGIRAAMQRFFPTRFRRVEERRSIIRLNLD